MAVKIRLRQQGRNNRQTYRVVVADSRSPRDGKYLEMLGWYNPFHSTEDNVSIDTERLNHWLSQGAQLSEKVENLLGKVAPALLKEVVEKRQSQRTKKVAKRRTLRRASK